ncbi:putative vacuole morphology and inheritance protein 14 protein [Phaeoacremonium minimum UCRPA7]|uniref:Putative vacuole morphology and inheritance protein 14 protein n=1 Tax=Phaeoacremonium minimum (strain UCR-PA7) TaxID=1286976 RepID=R8BT40_PHAM7|nr:putative vacuole morphology and inheritance protein 14 protein [Phaeoacremonium minimum UCRPA7]EOO02568.1 putative vacuole morphology and inheritance protein 14 protein [Phaeoacremonium minimum UCRPA7]
MDTNIQRALNDKLYDKRKVGALELERVIRELVASKDYDRVQAILDQLCNEYAYAVHQPHARNGGLIGLAAAAIALGSLGADSELSVKNGAELLDRLIKDIVSESAATYVSVLEMPADHVESDKDALDEHAELPTAFSLKQFIPLLKERSYTINPFTRTFLVGWIVLLDSIPDLELVVYLPEFLSSLLKFLSDPNRDVHVATQGCLDKFLNEIKRIARVKKGIAESRKSKGDGKRKREESVDSGSVQAALEEGDEVDSTTANEEDDTSSEDDWVPGQDVQINYRAILEILTASLDSPLDEDGLLESLRWIVDFLDICPEEVLPFTPKILAHLLPAMASGVESIRQAAARVNTSLMDYVVSLSDEPELPLSQNASRIPAPLPGERQDGASSTPPELSELRKRLRNLETKDGQTFFVALFRSWCYNAVATFSLCLLAQAYEQAYNLLQIFAELEMTVNILIQIDKLVQLLESPVFTYLRLQLLEPDKYPHIYKCLYGLLMLLPQSSAFAALKNRLNSVSSVGYLHIASRT